VGFWFSFSGLKQLGGEASEEVGRNSCEPQPAQSAQWSSVEKTKKETVHYETREIPGEKGETGKRDKNTLTAKVDGGGRREPWA